MAFSEKFEDALLLVAEKVDGNQYLTAIKNAFTAYMPFIIVGSFATLFNTLICSTSIGLAALIPAAASLKPAFTAIRFRNDVVHDDSDRILNRHESCENDNLRRN